MKMGHYAHYNHEKWNFTQIKKGKNSFKKKVLFCFGIEYGGTTDYVCR